MSVVDAIIRERSRRNTIVSVMFGFAVRKLVLWLHLSRSRRHLSKLSEEALDDIGLTRDRAFGEAIRPFWDTSNPPRPDRR